MLGLCFVSLGLFAVLLLAMLDVRRSSFFGGFVPWERRRPVPWNGFDILAIFVLYFLAMQFVVGIATGRISVSPRTTTEKPVVVAELKPTPEHPLTQLLVQGKKFRVVLWIVFFSAVIAAPIAEELLFRVLLQGWLEKLELALMRPWPRFLGVIPIALASVLFAGLHGGKRTEQGTELLVQLMIGIAIVNTLFPILAVLFLRFGRGASWKDLGLRFDRFFVDIRTVIIFFLLFIPPLFFLHASLRQLWPDAVTDPIPLFFFSAALGFLMYRTKRFAGPALLHAMLNGSSFLGVLLTNR